MIWAPMSVSSSRWWTPFTVPAVPTGIKIGVSIVPWSVSRSPARALEFKSVWVNSNFKKGKVRIISEGLKRLFLYFFPSMKK